MQNFNKEAANESPQALSCPPFQINYHHSQLIFRGPADTQREDTFASFQPPFTIIFYTLCTQARNSVLKQHALFICTSFPPFMLSPGCGDGLSSYSACLL